MSKSIAIFILSLIIFGGVVFPAFAQVQQLSFRDIIRILDRLASWMFIILLSVAVIMIIIAAYKYLTAGGDESKVSSAHKTLIYALVAIGVGILAKGFIFLVMELAGVSSFSGPSIQIQIPIPPIPFLPPPPPFPW
ncbi:MAG: hypothetical protein Q8L57_03685 [bacterium]|nr:hypothetical protein [bacterium]